MSPLTLELALVTKLKALKVPCIGIFEGLSTREERMPKVRAAVKQVADVTYRITDGKRVTMADAFRLAYQVEL